MYEVAQWTMIHNHSKRDKINYIIYFQSKCLLFSLPYQALSYSQVLIILHTHLNVIHPLKLRASERPAISFAPRSLDPPADECHHLRCCTSTSEADPRWWTHQDSRPRPFSMQSDRSRSACPCAAKWRWTAKESPPLHSVQPAWDSSSVQCPRTGCRPRRTHSCSPVASPRTIVEVSPACRASALSLLRWHGFCGS